jgi:hypothetical protein
MGCFAIVRTGAWDNADMVVRRTIGEVVGPVR